FVATDDRVKRVKVELGLTDSDHAEVLSGVAVGDEIVLAGHAGLKDDGLVKRVDENGTPVEASPEAQAATPDEPPAGEAEPEPAHAPDSGKATSKAKPKPKSKKAKPKTKTDGGA